MTEMISAADLPTLVGKELEPSPWIEITQERVNQFAAATNDFQFIHVDPEKAAQTPFGGPIAHGFSVAVIAVISECAKRNRSLRTWSWASTTALTRCAT